MYIYKMIDLDNILAVAALVNAVSSKIRKREGFQTDHITVQPSPFEYFCHSIAQLSCIFSNEQHFC